MQNGVSIVICCHNSAKRLPDTLKYLACQNVDSSLPWEVVVVDNASNDGTSNIAQRCWPEKINVRLLVVHEPKAGLSQARMRGLRSARYDIVSYIDDDNWVSSDWLDTLVEVFSEDDKIGVVGGPSEAVFETSPPPWFAEIQGYYAVGPQHEQSGDVTNAVGTILWGAGMSIRRAALNSLFDHGFEFLSTGRKGTQLLSGEDIEIGFALRAMGWQFKYDERLRIRHFMPAGRLTWSYARRLMRGMGMTSVYLTMYDGALRLPPFDKQPAYKRCWLFQFLKSVKNLTCHFLAHPICCITQTIGSKNALDFQRYLGILLQLLMVQSSYKSMIYNIESAPWNAPHRCGDVQTHT